MTEQKLEFTKDTRISIEVTIQVDGSYQRNLTMTEKSMAVSGFLDKMEFIAAATALYRFI